MYNLLDRQENSARPPGGWAIANNNYNLIPIDAPRPTPSGEKKLLVAIFMQSIHDLGKPTNNDNAKANSYDAYEYLFVTPREPYELSFPSLCEWFDANIGALRKRILWIVANYETVKHKLTLQYVIGRGANA